MQGAQREGMHPDDGCAELVRLFQGGARMTIAYCDRKEVYGSERRIVSIEMTSDTDTPSQHVRFTLSIGVEGEETLFKKQWFKGNHRFDLGHFVVIFSRSMSEVEFWEGGEIGGGWNPDEIVSRPMDILRIAILSTEVDSKKAETP